MLKWSINIVGNAIKLCPCHPTVTLWHTQTASVQILQSNIQTLFLFGALHTYSEAAVQILKYDAAKLSYNNI